MNSHCIAVYSNQESKRGLNIYGWKVFGKLCKLWFVNQLDPIQQQSWFRTETAAVDKNRYTVDSVSLWTVCSKTKQFVVLS